VSRYSTSYAPTCVGAAKVCDSYGTATTSPVCDITTVAGGTCTNGTTTCGGVGQPCCISTYSTSSSYYYCGGAGTRCLATSSGTTTQYTCAACGDKGQRCCIDSTTASSYGVPCKSPYSCASTYSSTTGTYTYMCSDPTGTATSTALGL
jgi:hypothetical protein